MIVFADYAPLEECQNDDVTELCHQCNKCRRFDGKEPKEVMSIRENREVRYE